VDCHPEVDRVGLKFRLQRPLAWASRSESAGYNSYDETKKRSLIVIRRLVEHDVGGGDGEDGAEACGGEIGVLGPPRDLPRSERVPRGAVVADYGWHRLSLVLDHAAGLGHRRRGTLPERVRRPRIRGSRDSEGNAAPSAAAGLSAQSCCATRVESPGVRPRPQGFFPIMSAAPGPAVKPCRR